MFHIETLPLILADFYETYLKDIAWFAFKTCCKQWNVLVNHFLRIDMYVLLWVVSQSKLRYIFYIFLCSKLTLQFSFVFFVFALFSKELQVGEEAGNSTIKKIKTVSPKCFHFVQLKVPSSFRSIVESKINSIMDQWIWFLIIKMIKVYSLSVNSVWCNQCC